METVWVRVPGYQFVEASSNGDIASTITGERHILSVSAQGNVNVTLERGRHAVRSAAKLHRLAFGSVRVAAQPAGTYDLLFIMHKLAEHAVEGGSLYISASQLRDILERALKTGE